MAPHPLTDFEIQNCFQDEPKFNGFYSINSLTKIKDEAYVINLDDFKSIRTHWIALHEIGYSIIYFDSFEFEHIAKEIKKFIGNKNIIKNIFRIQAYYSIMYGHFCIWFTDFML